MKLIPAFLCLLFTLPGCKAPSVKLAAGIDPDIVLVNIGEGDRIFIGNLLRILNNYEPAVIAIDVNFKSEKEKEQDSVLINALQSTKNDVLIYGLDEKGDISKSHITFSSQVSDEGYGDFIEKRGLMSLMMPVRKVGTEKHESFALKIVKNWKQGFRYDFAANKTIPINYSRSAKQFVTVQGSDANNIDPAFIKNKVVIVGYLGPRNEYKFHTPLRLVEEFPRNEPDTYGSVIFANEIRTILEYEQKNNWDAE